MRQHLLCARQKSRTLAALPLFEHTKILHTLTAMGSAALAAAVPWPGEATRFSRKERCVMGKVTLKPVRHELCYRTLLHKQL